MWHTFMAVCQFLCDEVVDIVMLIEVSLVSHVVAAARDY